MMKQIIQMKLNKVKGLYWWEANFTSVAEDLNVGLPRTNPASGNGAGLELGPQKYKSIAASFSDQEKKKRANSKERWGCKVIASRTMLFYFHAESLSARGEDQIEFYKMHLVALFIGRTKSMFLISDVLKSYLIFTTFNYRDNSTQLMDDISAVITRVAKDETHRFIRPNARGIEDNKE